MESCFDKWISNIDEEIFSGGVKNRVVVVLFRKDSHFGSVLI